MKPQTVNFKKCKDGVYRKLTPEERAAGIVIEIVVRAVELLIVITCKDYIPVKEGIPPKTLPLQIVGHVRK